MSKFFFLTELYESSTSLIRLEELNFLLFSIGNNLVLAPKYLLFFKPNLVSTHLLEVSIFLSFLSAINSFTILIFHSVYNVP